MARVEQEAQNDGGGVVAQSSSPAIQTPTSSPNHDQAVTIPPAPVNQHFLTAYYQNGAYSDLDIISGGVVRSVHRIVVCSESPVLEAMSSNLGGGQPSGLNQYDSETLDRVLNFCYRRTYSDGEYPETVAPFLTRMTAVGVRDTLEMPLAVASDVEDPGWWAELMKLDDSKDSEEDCDEEQDADDEEHQSDEEKDRVEDTNKYIPYSYDIHCALEYDSDSSDADMPFVNKTSEVRTSTQNSQPPYKLSLFTNLKVYIAAKELQIPALQLVARERFAHSFQAHWDRFADLPALIEQVYLRTDGTDALRTFICQIVAVGCESDHEMAFKAKIVGVMARNGEFATGVLDAALRLRKDWAWKE